MNGQIFISYRRDDSSAWAGRLYDRLFQRYPSNQIFMDVDTIEPGVDFVEAIEEVVGRCDVLIAVIGSRWLTSSDRGGRRRLDIPEDIVRLEIATALKRGIRVVPVLVDSGTMPEVGELPDDLKALVRRNAVEIGHNRFNADSEHLVATLERALGKATEEREQRELLETAGTPKVVYPPLSKSSEPEPAKPLGGTGGKTPSKKQLIAILTIGVVLMVGGNLYLNLIRPYESPPPQPAPPSASPSLTVIATPTPAPTSFSPVAVAIPSPSISTTPSKEELARQALDNATKERPWVNSLGMNFVPVADTQVLFSVWDTRVQDFETFVKNTGYDATEGMYSLNKDGQNQRGATWKKPGFSQGRNHPVVGVSWDDAKAFCEWLTKRERGSGALPEGMHYRLPTDEEWSIAVGLDSEPGNTPQEKDSIIKLYPWGTKWPPPPGAGNYAGEEEKIGKEPENWGVIEGYNDGYPRTSPVGSFAANKNGLYDMGGNVWQWCEDWYSSLNQYRVVRGGSWIDNLDFNVLSSSRTYRREPYLRNDMVGFRCVVAGESSR